MIRMSRYIGRDLVVSVWVSFLSLLAFFSIFELAEFMRVVAQAQKPVSLAWELCFWDLFVISNDVGPLALLVGVTLTGASLARRNEIIALSAAGISPFVVLAPALVIGAVFSAGLFFVADTLTPIAAGNLERIMAYELGRGSSGAYFQRHRQWFHTGGKFVRVGAIDSRQQTYFDTSVLTLDGGHVIERVNAAKVRALGAELVAEDVSIERYKSGELDDATLTVEEAKELILPLERGFNLFLDLFSKPQSMHLRELREVFALRKKHGYNPSIYESEYFGRMGAPFSSWALFALGAVLAFSVKARRSLLMSLFQLLGLTLFAFVLRQTFRAFANDGSLHSAVGAFAPSIVLTCIALYLLRPRGLGKSA
jgi:lipopolysaccharide export system permease protein